MEKVFCDSVYGTSAVSLWPNGFLLRGSGEPKNAGSSPVGGVS